jgi:hypothetical protein
LYPFRESTFLCMAACSSEGGQYHAKTRVARSGEGEALTTAVAAVAAQWDSRASVLCQAGNVGAEFLRLETGDRQARSGGDGAYQGRGASGGLKARACRSVTGTGHRHGVDAFAYIHDLPQRLAHDP